MTVVFFNFILTGVISPANKIFIIDYDIVLLYNYYWHWLCFVRSTQFFFFFVQILVCNAAVSVIKIKTNNKNEVESFGVYSNKMGLIARCYVKRDRFNLPIDASHYFIIDTFVESQIICKFYYNLTGNKMTAVINERNLFNK